MKSSFSLLAPVIFNGGSAVSLVVPSSSTRDGDKSALKVTSPRGTLASPVTLLAISVSPSYVTLIN